MKTQLFLMCLLAMQPVFGQNRLPVVRPPLDQHPNTKAPNPEVPPAPNPPNPYDPYGTRDGREGSVFSDANSAAMHFINIVDNQIYEGAWLDAGGVMHDVMPQKAWAEGMRATRMHLGHVRARRVRSHECKKALEGGLVGDFIVIKYDTEFANRPNSVERVTLMMHAPLGLWKVVSYQIDEKDSHRSSCTRYSRY